MSDARLNGLDLLHHGAGLWAWRHLQIRLQWRWQAEAQRVVFKLVRIAGPDMWKTRQNQDDTDSICDWKRSVVSNGSHASQCDWDAKFAHTHDRNLVNLDCTFAFHGKNRHSDLSFGFSWPYRQSVSLFVPISNGYSADDPYKFRFNVVLWLYSTSSAGSMRLLLLSTILQVLSNL